MTVGGKIELRVGPRATAALGSLFLVGSTLAASRITRCVPCHAFASPGVANATTPTPPLSVPCVCVRRFKPHHQ